jgi:hypothetical protein
MFLARHQDLNVLGVPAFLLPRPGQSSFKRLNPYKLRPHAEKFTDIRQEILI